MARNPKENTAKPPNKTTGPSENTQPSAAPQQSPPAASDSSPNRTSVASTAGSMQSVDAATGILDGIKGSIGTLGKTFDILGEEMTKMVQLGEGLETAAVVNRLKKNKEVRDEKLDKDIEGIKALQQEVLRKDVVEALRVVVVQEVESMIDDLVKQEVKSLLPHYIPQHFLNELAEHRRKLAEVQCHLHNSESQRANSLLTSYLNDPIHQILKSDGYVSQLFPKTISELLAMDDDSIGTLLRDYGLENSSGSRDHNINNIMRTFGLSYQLVPTNTGGSVLAKVS